MYNVVGYVLSASFLIIEELINYSVFVSRSSIPMWWSLVETEHHNHTPVLDALLYHLISVKGGHTQRINHELTHAP